MLVLTVGLSVVALSSGCAEDQPSADSVSARPSLVDPTTIESDVVESATDSPGSVECPQLVIDVPEDLVNQTEHRGDVHYPTSVGVIWSNVDGDRVVNVSSMASDEEMGDGTDAVPTVRHVQGSTGAEILVRGVHRIVWQQRGATPPCIYWAVVSSGLSEAELDSALASVRESRP